MMIFVLLSGAMIGARYRVASLVPSTFIAILVSAAIDRIHHVSLISMILTALAMTVALQIGYIIGATLRLVLRAAQASSATETGALRGWPGGIG
jgi:membrane protein DedA with SNARE-associated domain